jgi:hypothetical protein
LAWGKNTFNIEAPKNSQIELEIKSGGTRSGKCYIGFVNIGKQPTQIISIKLTAAGVQIK